MRWMRHEGLGLFVAGPLAPLALMAGLAIDVKVFSTVWVPIYEDDQYRRCVEMTAGEPDPVMS